MTPKPETVEAICKVCGGISGFGAGRDTWGTPEAARYLHDLRPCVKEKCVFCETDAALRASEERAAELQRERDEAMRSCGEEHRPAGAKLTQTEDKALSQQANAAGTNIFDALQAATKLWIDSDFKREAAEARAEKLAAALRAIVEDIEVCNWRCDVCGADPGMGETDLADTARRALAETGEGE